MGAGRRSMPAMLPIGEPRRTNLGCEEACSKGSTAWKSTNGPGGKSQHIGNKIPFLYIQSRESIAHTDSVDGDMLLEYRERHVGNRRVGL